MSNENSDGKLIGTIALIAIGLYLLYQIIIFAAKLFVYLGFNFFFFLDNLLTFNHINPIVMWGIWGLQIGSIVGVIIAVKRFKLSKILILYPIAFVVIFTTIMYFVNSPTQYPTLDSVQKNDPNLNFVQNTTPQISYYILKASANIRKNPSGSSQIFKKLYKGSVVEVLDKSNPKWYKCKISNIVGYINANLLTYSGSGNSSN